MIRRLLLALLLTLLIPIPGWAATTASFAWDANAPSDNVTNYVLLYGTTHGGPYPTSVSVGNQTTGTVAIPGIGTYYFVVEAQNAGGISGPSNEVAVTVPDPRCVFPTGDQAISIFPTKLTLTGSGGAGSKARVDFQVSSAGSPVIHIAVRSGVDLQTLDGTDLGALAGIWFTIPTPSGTYPLSILATNSYGCSLEKATGFSVISK